MKIPSANNFQISGSGYRRPRVRDSRSRQPLPPRHAYPSRPESLNWGRVAAVGIVGGVGLAVSGLALGSLLAITTFYLTSK